MSILIRGMEMPVNCRTCRFHRQWDGDTELHCLVDGEIWQNFYEKNRHPDCPLIEVPPHGRLIDADELKKHKKHSDEFAENIVAVAQIDWMPTVIPADKDGET